MLLETLSLRNDGGIGRLYQGAEGVLRVLKKSK